MPRTLKRPVGAPSGVDDIVAYTDERIPITASERICEILRTGDFVHAACAAAGVNESTYYGWLAKGAAAVTKHATGERLNANEKRYAVFTAQVRDAEQEGRQRVLGAISSSATVGSVQRTTTKKTDRRGKIIERTVREETRPPDVGAAQWIAERRWPKDWNRRQQLEVSGPEGGPIKVESPLASLMARLDAMDRREQAAIDTTAHELDPPDDDAASGA